MGNGRACWRGVALTVAFVLFAALPQPSAAQESGEAIVVRSDLVLEASDGTALALDAYLPKRGRNLPAIVLLHGGLWAGGDKTHLAAIGAALASRGWAAFALNYRLGVEIVDRQTDDVLDAVRFVRRRALEYHVDPDAIVLLGSSAGAHLGALAATQGRDAPAGDSRVAAFVAWSGIFDLSQLAPRGSEPLRDCEQACQELFAPGVLTGVVGCEYRACPRRYREESPISHIDGSDPPMLLAGTTGDAVPPEQARAMGAALDEAGVEAEVVIVPGIEHGEAVGARVFERTLDFLTDRTLREASPDRNLWWVALVALAAALVVAVLVMAVRSRRRSLRSR